MSFHRALVSVDEQLSWVVRVPEAVCGSSRAATAGHLAEALADLDALAARIAGGRGPDLCDLAALAARLALNALADLPDLPFIGEPFGGEDGSD